MAERYIPEHRRTQFKAKNTFKPEELRRRREEQQVEIRKAKREENLAKRRGIGGGDRPGASLGAEPDSDDDTAPTESQVSLQLWRKMNGRVLQVLRICECFRHALRCSLKLVYFQVGLGQANYFLPVRDGARVHGKENLRQDLLFGHIHS